MMSDDDMAELQIKDALFTAVRNFLDNNINPPEAKKFENRAKKIGHECVLDNNILWRRMHRHGKHHPVIIVPEAMAIKLIQDSIMYGHEGQFKTKEKMIQSYWWPGMDNDIINNHLSACEKCQKTKTDKRAKTNFLSSLLFFNALNKKSACLDHEKASGSGKKYIFCMTDAFTKYVELVALGDKEAQTVATALFKNEFVDTDCH